MSGLVALATIRTMLATLLAALCVQAPPLPPGAPSFVPTAREWTLGGAFVLKHEKFLQWLPVPDPLRPGGWSSAVRVIWRVELAPRTPALAGLSLGVESAAGPGSSAGIIRPRLQYRPPGRELRVGVELPLMVLRTLVGRALRPSFFISGRF